MIWHWLLFSEMNASLMTFTLYCKKYEPFENSRILYLKVKSLFKYWKTLSPIYIYTYWSWNISYWNKGIKEKNYE